MAEQVMQGQIIPENPSFSASGRRASNQSQQSFHGTQSYQPPRTPKLDEIQPPPALMPVQVQPVPKEHVVLSYLREFQ